MAKLFVFNAVLMTVLVAFVGLAKAQYDNRRSDEPGPREMPIMSRQGATMQEWREMNADQLKRMMPGRQMPSYRLGQARDDFCENLCASDGDCWHGCACETWQNKCVHDSWWR